MAKIHWLNPVSGSFTKSRRLERQGVPGAD